MFRVDQSANRITKLKTVRFSDLGLRERDHLQEWLANSPEALGEDLLIIQKEFAGFDDTKERLDLLALDKQGALVIIENKLDDSGRDVVWQCLKYASYCSTLSKTSIADIYQQFLDQNGGGDAKTNICEFLGQEDFEEVSINSGTSQRLILVAALFRKEVTSTVLWLIKHGVRVECFKATPFQDGEQVFLTIEQIIPLAEAEELMIGIAEKEKEEQTTERGQARRHTLRNEFWRQMLEALESAGVDLYANVGPSDDHWLSAGSGLSGVHYSMIFSRDCARVEFVIGRGTAAKNKATFDHLYARKDEIEKRFGAPLEWRRLNNNKVSIICFEQEFDGYDKANWPEITKWLVEHVKRIEATFAPEIDGIRNLLRTKFPKES
jgi:hypothetical protein